MSNAFYNYLSEKVIKFFQTNQPSAGDKFFVLFEKDIEVQCFYEEMKNNILSKEYSYVDNERGQKYDTYELDFGAVQLIVAAAMNGSPHPDFLANLRNLVGVCDGYVNKAILFIHCSSLTSILEGAGDLSKEGMPLNTDSIIVDIKRRINETGYSELDKTILTEYLDNKKQELEGSSASAFEYEDILECLSDSQITAKEYKKFDLFPDNKLASLNGKELKHRLQENHRNFVKVSEIHSYGADYSKLENLYGEDGAKALIKDTWEDVTFSEIEKYIENKKSKVSVEYIPIVSEQNIWDREEGTSKAKSRIRNILVFVGQQDEQAEIVLSFTDFTKNVGINIPKQFQSVLKVVNSGKKLMVSISNIDDQALIVRFFYEIDGIRFDFRIAVLRCEPKILESIKTEYSVEIKSTLAIRINTDDDEVNLNESAPDEKQVHIIEKDQVITMGKAEHLKLVVGEEYPYTEESEDVCFVVSTDVFSIPMIKAFAVEKPTVIEGMKVWYLKRIRNKSFEMVGDNSLVLDTKKYWTRGDFRKSLELERKFIDLGVPFALEEDADSAELVEHKLVLPNEVAIAFNKLINYFRTKKSIPSLAFIDLELRKLYEEYLNAIISRIKLIEENAYLKEEEKALLFIGTIKRKYGECEILISPLHPINVAYQMFMSAQNIEGIEEDNYDLLRRFQHSALLPYINIDPYSYEPKVYIPIEQMHSPEWKVYVEEDLPRYKGSKDFVSKLVQEKIREYVEHFEYLFPADIGTPIKINLINTGDCKEIVQGILKYYAYYLSVTKNRTVLPIQVTMYAKYKMDTAFEMVSQVDDPVILLKTLGIDIKVDGMSTEEIIDIYRKNVSFFFKDIESDFDYSHITFIEMDDDHQAINTVMSDIPSGVVMSGISSGVPSEMLGDSYRTGFGTRYTNMDSNLMVLASQYNALNAAMNGDSFRAGSCYALKMGVGKQKILDKIYDASNWVTFINPKVDLNYFKNDSSAKDLMIIHYSDQYNMTSSGYDAITVTKKSKQYQNAIEAYLNKKGVDNVNEHSKRIINMFNALNGDWLLRMLSYKSYFPVEKLSILSAMKLAVKRYSIDEIIWVPISLEEILRVSGAVGLGKSESIFSAKNLGFEGQTSDDLLLVGIKNADKVQVTFYPIEVKIGKLKNDYLEKGVKQAIRTREIFDEVLQTGPCEGKDIKTRLYRNFFMQQVLINAGKLIIYDVCEDDTMWKHITQSDLRRKLLNEEYEIVDSLIPDMGKAGVISFKEDCNTEREFRNQDILILEKSEKDGVNLLAKKFEDIPSVDWSVVQEESLIAQEEPQPCGDESSAEVDVEVEAENTDIGILNEGVNTQEIQSTSRFAEVSARVLIGKDSYNHDVFWEFGNKALANRHMLITGTSGQGKTYSIQTMLYELAKYRISSVIFDYTEGFMLQQLEQPFKTYMGDKIKQHIVYSTGVPINPFKRQQIELIPGELIWEKEADVAARLADIFAHVYDFGDQQYSAIFDAVYNGLIKYGDKMSMKHFRDELEEVTESNKTAKSVLSKMSPFFHTVEFSSDNKFDWGDILYGQDSQLNIIQLTMFTQEMKVIITEMMLWDAWYYSKKYGTKDKPFVVVLDEAQNLSHAMKSPSAAILTEGRKFGWSAWFATQSLGVLKNDEIVRLMQSAFKLYFKPTDNEMIKMAKQLDVTGETDWLPVVQKLKKGQCISVGDKMKPNGNVGPAAPVLTSITSFEGRD